MPKKTCLSPHKIATGCFVQMYYNYQHVVFAVFKF